MKRSNRVVLVWVAVLGFLGGCGGGSSSTVASPSTLSGKAAVGFPIVSAAVKVACAGGAALNTTTDSTGAWTVTLSGQSLPCAVEVSSGSINGASNSILYHSVATNAGTVNVTPLTDLLVANLTGIDPATWFSGVSGANASTLAQINATALSSALAKVRAALPALTALATVDPITLSFTAASGNAIDDMLSALRAALAASSVNYTTLLASATASTITVPAGLGTALTISYANTTTGGATAGGTTTASSSGCTGDTAAFFTTYAGTHQVAAVTYDGGSGHPTVVGFVNGTTYTVVVNSNCTINVGALTLTYKPNSFFSSQGSSPTKMNTQAAMLNPAIVFGNFELPDGPPLLLQFSDPAVTANSLMFTF